jgi:predicted dehydrogenase
MGGAVNKAALKPRLGFLGLGWIGRARLQAVAPQIEVAGVADPAITGTLPSLKELLELDLDGVVIATPSALHAEQAVTALAAGVPVFCQKPLGRNAAEAAGVVDAAQRADLLLGVDFCYRHSGPARALQAELCSLGDIYAVELAFHNAYGPDKPWFYDPALAGGGCLLDLGIHLVDLALWLLEPAEVVRIDSHLLHHGGHAVEDYAIAFLGLSSGIAVSLACSWNLPIGRDCVLEASIYGSQGGARLRNAGGSFYHLQAERLQGTRAAPLVQPGEDWGGNALAAWIAHLGQGFDPELERVLDVHRIIDRIYQAAAP